MRQITVKGNPVLPEHFPTVPRLCPCVFLFCFNDDRNCFDDLREVPVELFRKPLAKALPSSDAESPG